MNLKTGTIALFEWTSFGFFILFLSLCVYDDTVAKKFPILVTVFMLLSLFSVFILRDLKIKRQIKDGELSRYGKNTQLAWLSIALFGVAALNLVIVIIDFYHSQFHALRIVNVAVFMMVGFQRRTNYYLVITEKKILKNGREQFLLANIEEMEVFENLVELRSQKKVMQIGFEQLTSDEKEKLLLELERIAAKTNASPIS